jgi:hypothetical protein
LIAGAGVYAIAALLEWLIANAHDVSVASIHEHTIVPWVVHALATASIPVSLFPAVQRTALTPAWVRIAGGVVIAVMLVAGQTLTAGFSASVLSAAALVWQRHSSR